MNSSHTLCKANNMMHIAAMLSGIRRLSLVLLLALPLGALAAEQKSFATPDEAVDALLAALKADDDTALLAIFGDKHKSLVVTSDRAANSVMRADAVTAIQTYRLLEEQGQNRRVLLIGDQAWPLPIPPSRMTRIGNAYEFFQPLRPTDRITATWRLTHLEARPTRLGEMLFVDSDVRYTNQRGELLAVNRETVAFAPIREG